MSLFDTNALDTDVVAHLAVEIADQTRSATVEPRLKSLIARKKKLLWEPLISAASQIVESQNASIISMPAALGCLGTLRTSENAAQAECQRLADQGHLTNRLNEAHGASNAVVEARAAALLILCKRDFPSPNGIPWDKALSERPQLTARIDDALSEFGPPISLDSFLEIANANGLAKPLIRAIVTLRLRENRIGALNIAQVIERLPQYLDCVENNLHDEFFRQVASGSILTFESRMGFSAGSTCASLAHANRNIHHPQAC